MKLHRTLIIALLSIVISTGSVASKQDIKILINGKELHTDASPKIVNNRILLPVRASFESLGAKVDWHQDTRTVTAKRGDDIIKLQLDNSRATVNGKEIILDVPATSIGTRGRILVPVRFISESLGYDVKWNEKTQTVSIKSQPNGIKPLWRKSEDVLPKATDEQSEITRSEIIKRSPKAIVMNDISFNIDVGSNERSDELSIFAFSSKGKYRVIHKAYTDYLGDTIYSVVHGQYSNGTSSSSGAYNIEYRDGHEYSIIETMYGSVILIPHREI